MARVLVIDDDPFIARLAAAKIAQLGHEVETAADGRDGLMRVQGQHRDLILLDLMMPLMSGMEVCRAIRASEESRDTPVIMLTGKVQERDIEAGFDAGATDYLTKPFSPRELQARVQAHLNRASHMH